MINLLIAISSFLALFLAILTYQKNPNSLVNKSFAALSLSIAVWAVGFIPYNNPPFGGSALWIKIVYVNAILMVAALYHFSYAFPKGDKPKNFWFILYFVLNIAVIYSLFFTDEFVVGVVQQSYGPDTKLGSHYPYLIPIWISYLSYALFRLIRNCLHATGVVRQQFLFIFLGMGMFMALIILFDGIIPIVYNTSYFFSLSAVASLFFITTTAYAIIRHRLMDIRFVIVRTITYSFLIFLVALVFITLSSFVSFLILGVQLSLVQRVITIFITLLVAVSFNSMKQAIERMTDRFFYQGNYDSDALLTTLGKIMNTNIDLYPLVDQLIYTLTHEMRITRGAFVLLENGQVYDVIPHGYEQLHLVGETNIPILAQYTSLVFDDLEEGPLKEMMRKLGVAVSQRLEVEGRIIGILILGEKSSGKAYTDRDLKVLTILMPEIAVSVQNSQAYDKIKQFNITLSEEVRKATNELQKANARLQELDKLKNDFVSVASHELRTPMTAIRSYAWMALYKSDMQLSDKMKKYLERVYVSTERLINLVNDMLNISRLEDGRVEITPSQFNILDEVQGAVAELEPKMKEKGQTLQIQPSRLPQVFADPNKVHQVLLNLLGNAIKFTPNKGTIKVEFFFDGVMVFVSIQDTGVGIMPEELPKLFTKFGRLEHSYTAAATSGGTGLGLYISKVLVELMGGKISATSEGPGKGSRFTFSVPLATQEVISRANIYTRKPMASEARSLEPVAI